MNLLHLPTSAYSRPNIEAIKTLGKERIDEGVINKLKNRVPEDKRKQLLEEATGVSEWIYEVIRKVCLE